MFRLTTLLALATLACVNADMYLHNMRGSNNRLDEARRDRNNANRLFDSQNNNRGGSNVGRMYYFEGEKIPLEWTNQHGCGNDYNDCQIVVQYMCGLNLRDGVTTRTIPDQPSNCLNNDCNRDIRYGMHEDYDYYMNCKYRYRNRGLFTADRNLQGQTARYTRQNNNGARRGYECPEERDHYPYWHPTPWIDMAVFANNASMCDFYQAESENVKGRHFCSMPDSWYHHMVSRGGNGRNGFIPNTDALCTALNQDGSPMVNFLEQQATAALERAQAVAAVEFESCTTALGQCGDSKDDGTGAHAACLAALASQRMDPADLERDFPACPAGFSVHPVSSCFCYADASCDVTTPNAMSWVEPTEDEEGNPVCPPLFEIDPHANDNCVLSTCLASFINLASVEGLDDRRAEALEGRYLMTAVGGNLTCAERRVLGAQCALENLPMAEWKLSEPHNVRFPWAQAPFCREAQWSRPNHLGNGMGEGHTNGHNITFPPDFRQHCAMRVRYNITTADYNGASPFDSGAVNAGLNKERGRNVARIQVNAAHRIPTSDSAKPYTNERGYYFKQNPQVQIFDFHVFRQYCKPGLEVEGDPTRCYQEANGGGPDLDATPEPASDTYCPHTHTVVTVAANGNPTCNRSPDADPALPATANTRNNDDDFVLQLAINTNQFGRTFQDRTHSYQGRALSAEQKRDCGRIHALNVRGKRGNIVQTFPGTEYDMTPNRLHVAEGDCIHFQWTGSNTNPNNNDGQGKQGTDRSNIALLEYVRGEGGRGVERFGGKGRGGTTWTTKDMEPGYEGWGPDMSPTMGDVQCPPTANPATANPALVRPHPNNYRLCVNPDPAVCAWQRREFTIADADSEAPTKVFQACPAGYTVDPENVEACITVTCTAPAAIAPRDPNLASWTAGMDLVRPNSPTFSEADIGVPDALKFGGWGHSHPEHLANLTGGRFLGLSYEQLVNLAILDNVQFGGEMSELDDAGTYFDMDLHRTLGKGTFHYLCTRNNNFSNRSQKGKIAVVDAPAEANLIGSQGGVITISDDDSFQDQALFSDAQRFEDADFALEVPRMALDALDKVELQVFPAGAEVGLSQGASDVLWIGSSSGWLAAKPRIVDFQLAPAAGRQQRRSITAPIWGQLRIVDGNTLWYHITSDGFEAFAREWLARPASELAALDEFNPHIILELFSDSGALWASSRPAAQLPAGVSPLSPAIINNEYEVEGRWLNVPADAMRAIEQGQLRVSVWAETSRFDAAARVDPETGKPFVVRMPVSVSVMYGTIFHWPDTETGRACAKDADASGCRSIRQPVAGSVEGGEAVFEVGGSQTTPANGFYQVSEGSNLPLIIGLTAAALIIVLASVGSAVYFRKHPEKWESFKGYGPRKYKAVKRSLASNV